MAYSQVKNRLLAYTKIPEVGTLAELNNLPNGQTVLLRGRIIQAEDKKQPADALVVYQVRPKDGREVRFREEFPLVFPAFVLALDDGEILVQPSKTEAQKISYERHYITVGDRELTGFRIGDLVSVQGHWQPARGTTNPIVAEVTGVSGRNKTHLLTEVDTTMYQVRVTRDILGVLTLFSIILLIMQVRLAHAGQLSNAKAQQQPMIPYENRTAA